MMVRIRILFSSDYMAPPASLAFFVESAAWTSKNTDIERTYTTSLLAPSKMTHADLEYSDLEAVSQVFYLGDCFMDDLLRVGQVSL